MSEKPANTHLRKVSDAEIAAAVAESTAYMQISKKLGLAIGGGTVRSLKRRISKLKLDVSHFKGYSGTRKPPTDFSPRRSSVGATYISDLTDEEFATILAQVETYQAFGKAIGRKSTAGSFAIGIRKRAKQLGLSMEHFVFIKEKNGGVRRKRSSVFVQNSPAHGYPAPRIRDMLIAEGLLPNQCNRCGLPPEWQDKPLGLTLFCKNGDRSDLRIENVELLCPNCFSQSNRDYMSARGKRGVAMKMDNFKKRRYREIMDE